MDSKIKLHNIEDKELLKPAVESIPKGMTLRLTAGFSTHNAIQRTVKWSNALRGKNTLKYSCIPNKIILQEQSKDIFIPAKSEFSIKRPSWKKIPSDKLRAEKINVPNESTVFKEKR